MHISSGVNFAASAVPAGKKVVNSGRSLLRDAGVIVAGSYVMMPSTAGGQQLFNKRKPEAKELMTESLSSKLETNIGKKFVEFLSTPFHKLFCKNKK